MMILHTQVAWFTKDLMEDDSRDISAVSHASFALEVTRLESHTKLVVYHQYLLMPGLYNKNKVL